MYSKESQLYKPTALSEFVAGNKIFSNKYNDYNPENIDTLLSVKDNMSQSSKDEFTGKTNEKKLQIMMKNTRRKHKK